MATVTVRQVPARVIAALKALARENDRSMEQEIRLLLAEYIGERETVLQEIEAGWKRQKRRPSAREIDSWIRQGGR
jgi:plasmid stability protein